MSDAASNQKLVGRCIDQNRRREIVLVQIWREVLRVIFAGELGRLDEFKREMWLLLVAAGSGYLARCWHKTLKPKAQLTEFAHLEPHDHPREELVVSNSTELSATEAAPPNALLRRNMPASLGNELVPKPLKRNFSPKALGKKLFSSDSSKSSKTAKKEAQADKNSTSDESNNLVLDGNEISSSKKGPWSSFKTKKSPSFKESSSSEESSRESLGCLKRTGDSFRKSRDRRRSDNGSSSSRSLHAFFTDGDSAPSSVESSRREVDDSVHSSTGLSVRSLSGGFDLAAAAAEPSEIPLGSDKVLEDAAASQLRPKVVENEAKPAFLPGAPGRFDSKKDLQGSVSNNCSSSRSDVHSSVAEVVARIEKVNLSMKAEALNAAVHCVRGGANPGSVQAAVIDREKVRNLKLDGFEQNFVEDVEVLPGGKGKRRADAGKVDGDGKALPASITGKRTKDSKDLSKSMPREFGEVTLTSITCKRMKDVSDPNQDAGEAGEPSTLSPIGTVDLSQVFFGFDREFFGSPNEEKSPFACYKKSRYVSRSVNRGTMRRMRESPRPVSALESCLRAQFPLREEGSRVARSLNFTSLVSQRRDSLERGAENPFLDGEMRSPGSFADGRGIGTSDQTEGVLGLPVLKSPSKRSAKKAGEQSSERGQHSVANSATKYPRKVVLEDRGRVVSTQSTVNDVLWRPTTLPVALKKRKVSQACSPSATSTNNKSKGYELEALVIPPMEGLLFSFGVGIGVMSLINEPDGEVERLSRELHESEEKIENLNNLLRQAKDSSVQASGPLSKEVIVTGSLATEVVIGEVSGNNEPLLNRLGSGLSVDETGRELFELYRKEAPETPQQIEHMAELEAELEAELDALTSGMSEDGNGGPPDFEELDPDGVAGMADRDLGVEGLPALLDWDDDNDDFITEELVHSGGGIPPRELSRLLRKFQSSRQEHLIAELEADLKETVEKLQTMERELKCLREKTSSAPAAASKDFEAEVSDTVAEDSPNGLVDNDDRLLRFQIELLKGNPFEDQEYVPDEDDNILHKSGITTTVVQDAAKPSDKPTPSIPARHEPGPTLLRSVTSDPVAASLQGSTARELVSSLQRSMSSDLGSNFRTSGSESSFSARGSVSSVTLTEKSIEAQADNDAVCDEFLSSVFGSPENDPSRGDSVVTSPLILEEWMPPAFNRGISAKEDDKKPIITSDIKDLPGLAGTKSGGEDLDQVVGELLKRDSSSVKNAINAFLLWEAETDNVPIKDDMGEDGTSPRYSRRTAGKNPTPHKTIVSSASPQKTSVLSSRLEQLARSAFTSDKMPYVDKKLGFSNDRIKKEPEDGLEIFQPPVPKIEEKSAKLFGLWDRSPIKKDQSSQIPRREGGLRSDLSPIKKDQSLQSSRREGGFRSGSESSPIRKDLNSQSARREGGLRSGSELSPIRKDLNSQSSRREGGLRSESSGDSLRDLFRNETPVFGGEERDFNSLLDNRRELRYSSGKVQLSYSGPSLERDAAPTIYRQREDGNRAGTNSPTGRQSSIKAYQSPKLKNSRLGLENRLYLNPTSDWLSEIGSPPDK